MKLIQTGLILMLLAARLSAQYNIPTELPRDYCSHLKSAIEHQKEYYFPVTSNPLLDQYDVHFYFLDIQAENDTVYIAGNVTITATVTAAQLDTFAFELIDEMSIDSVFINGAHLGIIHQGDMGLVPLQTPLEGGQLIKAKICYHGTPPTGGFFTGISTGYNQNWDKHVTWTLSEPYGAKEWFPVKQDLTDKADSAWVWVTTSPENKVGSEGLLTGVTTMPNGKLRYEWKTRYPIDYYLISIAVADYQDYSIYAHPENMEDSILIQNYIYDDPAYLQQWKTDIDRTADFIELYSELFGPYPFAEEKYGHCVAEIGGGMEHQTMTTLYFFTFSLVSHELGHMWFGDNVTCATWNDIWLNEGFATYTSYLAHHYLAAPIYDSIWLKATHDNVKSQPGGSVYVPDSSLDDIWRIFDGRLSYDKGSLLLHMMRYELQDDDLFFHVLQHYDSTYAGSVATATDFKNVLEEMSGKDFDTFFDQWYYGEGYPIFNIVWNQTDDTLNIYANETASTTTTPFFNTLMPYYVKFADGTDSTFILRQESPHSSFAIPLAKAITDFQVDPKQWILHELNSLVVGMENEDDPVYFSLGPNPAQDNIQVFIQHDSCKNCRLVMSDLTGRVLMDEDISWIRRTIDLSAYSAGIYMVTVTNGINSMSRKIVKIDD